MMSVKKQYLEFRKVLKECLSDMSQREFAKLVDVSPEHLNRMLNQDFIGQPSVRFLNKLYEVRPDLREKYDLFDLCGYKSEPSEMVKIHQMLYDITKCMYGFIYREDKILYPDAESLIINTAGHIRSLHLSQDGYGVVCHLEKQTSDALVLDIIIDSVSYLTHVYMGIGYTHEHGVLIPMSIHQDGAWFVQHGFLPEWLLAEYETCEIDVSRLQSVFYCVKKTEKDATAGLLQNVLGIGEEYETTMSGFGFYLTELTNERLLKFFYKHQNALPEKVFADLESCLEAAKDCRSAWKDYMCESTSCTGYGALISNVMTKETGHWFGFQNETDFPENQPCIMCMDDVPLKERMIVYDYAKELGISYIQQVYVKMMLYKDQHSIIKVE